MSINPDDPAALRTLILAQPDGSPIRVAYAAGDVECANALNTPTVPAFVPRRELLVILGTYRLLSVLDSVVLHRRVPGTGEEPSDALFSVCANLRWVLLLASDNLRTPIVDAKAGCPLLAPFAVPSMTTAQLEGELEAVSGLVSLWQAETGDLDEQVTPKMVAATRTI